MSTDVISTRALFDSASNEDLEPLVEYILKASTESLSSCPRYKRYRPDHARYVDTIYDEIRLFGGNTFVNLFRKEGPPYFEVLEDAAEKVGVKDAGKFSTIELEQHMIQALLRKVGKEAAGKEGAKLQEALREAGMNERDYKAFISGTSLASLLAPHLYRLFMYEASTIIASAIAKQMLGHGLRVGAGFAAGRAGSLLLGPVGWVLAGLWTAADIAGPAYRVTVPCTLHIAMLRQKWLAEQETAPLETAFDD
ncbi:hypothetical protein D3C78_282840 [compost metagenome]